MPKIILPENNLPSVAIVGRPNVGKSSLFNCILGKRVAIVHEASGVTRDRVMAPASYSGRHFQLIDTGGLGTLTGETRKMDRWDKVIAEQAEAAIEGADVLIFVTSIREGLHTLDKEVAQRLRTAGKKVLLAVNQCDNDASKAQAVEFAELGFSHVYPISCMHRLGLKDLLDALTRELPPSLPGEDGEKEEERPFSIAVAGRPNVGKSSLVNALLGEERVIVSDVPGTTRDAVDIHFLFEFHGESRPAVLVDTAGLRRKGKVDTVVEYFSGMRTENAIRRADLVLLVVEASPDGVSAQDKRLAALVQDAGKACILVANKFDLQRGEHPQEELSDMLRRTLPGMSYAPIVFISAKENRNLGRLLDTAAEVLENTRIHIGTPLLNRVLSDAFSKRTPPVVGNAPLKMYYASRISALPPRFLLFVNNPAYCAPNYLAYLRNEMRQAFGLAGLPVELVLREKPRKVTSFHSPSRTPHKRGPKKG